MRKPKIAKINKNEKVVEQKQKLHATKAALLGVSGDVKSKEKQAQSLVTEIAELKKVKESLDFDIAEKNVEVLSLNEDLSEVSLRIKASTAAHEQIMDDYQRREDKIEREIGSLEERLLKEKETVSKELSKLQSGVQVSFSRLRVVRDDLSSTQTTLKTKGEELKHLQKDIISARHALLKIQEENTAQEKRQAELLSRVDEVKMIEDALDSKSGELSRISASVIGGVKELEKLTKDISIKKDELRTKVLREKRVEKTIKDKVNKFKKDQEKNKVKDILG